MYVNLINAIKIAIIIDLNRDSQILPFKTEFRNSVFLHIYLYETKSLFSGTQTFTWLIFILNHLSKIKTPALYTILIDNISIKIYPTLTFFGGIFKTHQILIYID